jgi:hypothetical protein
MKKLRFFLILMVIALLATAGVAAAQSDQRNFRAHLSGDNEVPPVDTLAQGQAIFKLSDDGTALHYKLIAANIDNILQAHIHVGPAGANGPVVAFLYPSAPPAVLIPGRFDGVLATGTITAANLVGPLAGQSLDSLIAEMRAGNTYTNVHTIAFPGGEVRGQNH